MNSTQKTVLAGAVGLVAGAAAGILLAPDSGKKTRKKIADSAESLKTNIEDFVEESKEALKDFARNGSEKEKTNA